VWPLPVRLSTDVLRDPASSGTILIAVTLTAVGLAVIVGGVLWRRMRWSMIVFGAIVTLIFGQYLKDFISEAYPTSFYVSPTGYSTASIARGRKIFVEYCSACHGPTGHGEGPVGANMEKNPANLVADHIYAHTDGDLFWWITHGIEDAMPGFGEALDDAAQWNLIDFIRANADATRLAASPGAVSLTGYPIPNFSVQCPDGLNVSIEAWRGRMIHIIVAGIDSAKQLKQFSERDRAAEVSTILIALNTSVAPEATACVADDEDVVETFALYRGESVSEIEGTEFLIDASGSLRAVWYPGVQPDWKNPRVFNEVIERMRRTPAQQRSRVSHVHG
jgi:mono/diheme cytochrome c family protein